MTITIPSGASSGDIAVTSAYGTGKVSGIVYSPSESNSAPVDIFLTSNAIEENNEIGKEVGTFVAQDGEDDGLKYELINGTNSEDNASFRIDTATNKLIAKVSFNYEAKSILNIRVKGVDANANILEKSFQIKVADVSEGIPVSTFVSISGHFSPSRLFIKNDSTLWGVFPNNAYGQLGDSTFVAKKGIFQIGKFKFLKAVTNSSSVFAIKSDSTLWSWGLNNTSKILGDATTTTRNIPSQISADKYIDISIGGQNVLAIKADGSLWGWGDNTNGQLGDTSSAVKTLPTKLSNQTFTKATCYNNTTFLIATDGTLWAAGLNDLGQLGDGSKVDKKAFTKISNDKFKTVYISQSGETYAIATDSSLWAWGTNNSGELGLGLSSTDTVFSPRKVPNIKILDLGASGNNLVVIKSDSTLWGCGNNDYYKLGDTITTFSNTLRLLDSKKYIKLYAHGAGSTTAVDKYGNAFVMGLVAYSSDSSYYPSNYSIPTLFNNAKNQQINSDFGSSSFLWQKSDQSWWSDINGSYIDSLVKLSKLNIKQLKEYNFVKIAGQGGYYTALNNNGELYTWGNNFNGTIGDGTTTNRLVPYKVSNDKFIDVSLSLGSMIALKEDGSLWGWGNNAYGKLGDGTTSNRLTPTLIDAGPFVSVNNSYYSGYALKPEGRLYSWGYNAYGQLGNGTNTTQYVPKIAGTTKFNKVLPSVYNGIGLGKDSLVYTWGYNNQLANGTYSATATLINLSSSIKFTDIGIAGSSFTNMAYYAIAADGSLYSWGYNGNGQLGSGSFTSNFTPTKVSSDVYKAISSYNNSSVYFIKADGKTYATGVNNWNYLDHESIKVPYINMFPNVIPYTPNTTDTSYCSAATASAIVASNTIDGESTILKYYTLATGGTSSSTAFVPSTVKADTINYYVSQINKRGYESARKKLTVIIKATPVAPTVTDTAYCNNSVIDSLNATAISGNTLYWYGINATGGTKTIARTIADTRTVGSSAYYVSQFNPNGCESPRAKITVKINALPANPIATNNFFCQGDTGKIASVSVLSGNKIYWYGTNATGGSGSLAATKVVANAAGNYNYYATQKNDTTGCESGRTAIPIFITAPLSTPIISRDASSNLVSSATYGNSWYKDGVKISDTTNTFKPTAIGKYTVKSSFLGCTSSMSGEYYYLITDVININASEFIKLVPNPFSSQINIDYSIKGYQKLSVEIFDIATGNRAGLIENVSAGSSLFLGNLSSGTYLIKVSSPDHKQSYQFKMIKL
jgi:alpha-tubulin suppressor-like RCC1 family protein